MTPEPSLYEQLSAKMREQYEASVTATVLYMLENAKSKLSSEVSYLLGQMVKAALQNGPINPANVASLYQACQIYDSKMGVASSLYHISSTLYALPSTGLVYMLIDARNRVKADEVIKYIDQNMQLSAKIRAGRTDARILLDVSSANALAVAKIAGTTGLQAAQTLAAQAYKLSQKIDVDPPERPSTRSRKRSG